MQRTLDHLFNNVLGENPIEKCHVFIRDRTRAVRKDFGVQNVKNMDAVRAHERIARFHILSLHEMCELDEEKFSEQQENEQLRKGRTFEHSKTPRILLKEPLNLSPFHQFWSVWHNFTTI